MLKSPYREATGARDTESLAWGHTPAGLSPEITPQVSRALKPRMTGLSLLHPTEAESS